MTVQKPKHSNKMTRHVITFAIIMVIPLMASFQLFAGMKQQYPSLLMDTIVDAQQVVTVQSDSKVQVETAPTPEANNEPEANDRHIMFVHIGKAGGRSLRKCLTISCFGHKVPFLLPGSNATKQEAREQCVEKMPKTRVAALIKSKGHAGNFLSHDNVVAADTFFYNLRHPVDRAMAAYWVKHAFPMCTDASRRTVREGTGNISGDGKCRHKFMAVRRENEHVMEFFVDCFAAAEDFAHALARNPLPSPPASSSVMDPKCHLLAAEAMAGHHHKDMMEYTAHYTQSNFRNYFNKTLEHFPDKDVVAIRTKNLWEDMSALDIWLGGNGDFTDCGGGRQSGGDKIVDKKPLTPEGFKVVCCALQEEMVIYKEMLFRASNLSPAEKQETWAGDIERCGASSLSDLAQKCESLVDMNLIKNKLRERWGNTYLDSKDKRLFRFKED